MSFDLFAVVIAFVLAGLGYHAGALKQLNRLAGLVLAFFAAPTVAAVFKELWFQEVEPGQPLVEWALLGLAGVAVYALVAIVGFLVIRLMRLSSDELTRKDRIWGGLMGALKGALVVWLAAQSVLLIEEPLQKADPKDVLRLQRSALVEIVRDHPVALDWALPELTQLQTLLEGARQRPAQEVRDDAAAQRLLSWEGVPELLADPEVREAVEAREYSRLLARADVRDLLADPAFRETLKELAW